MSPIDGCHPAALVVQDVNNVGMSLLVSEALQRMHPTAQLRLGDALNVIGGRDQVFIVTHSPYLIRKFNSESHRLVVIAGKGDWRRIDSSIEFGLFGLGEPTWGEINYRAFSICSVEFHNELYGFVQSHLDAQKPDGMSAGEAEVDRFLVAEGLPQSKTWRRTTGKQYPATLPVYVRNSIHHPENDLNSAVSDSELRASTDALVDLVGRIRGAAVSSSLFDEDR